VLSFLACLVLARAQDGVAVAPIPNTTGIPFFPGRQKITVCVSEWSPAVYCKGVQDPVDWTGLEIEVFQEIMPIMGWTYDMIGTWIHFSVSF